MPKPDRAPAMTAQDDARVGELCRQGLPARRIAEAIGHSYGAVKRSLARQGGVSAIRAAPGQTLAEVDLVFDDGPAGRETVERFTAFLAPFLVPALTVVEGRAMTFDDACSFVAGSLRAVAIALGDPNHPEYAENRRVSDATFITAQRTFSPGGAAAPN